MLVAIYIALPRSSQRQINMTSAVIIRNNGIRREPSREHLCLHGCRQAATWVYM